jgi:alpha-D-glucose phosphate-specific phosphoglucomutase
VAQYLLDTGKAGPGVIVGYDTRFASEFFAIAAAEILAGNGIKALLVNKATPTPVISFAILAHKTAGAINITASHNPPTDNGFKIRSEYAGAAAPETLVEIEKRINDAKGVKRLARDDAAKKGLIEVFDAAPPYLAHLPAMLDVAPIRQSTINVVVDSMWGAGMGWLSSILSSGAIKVSEIHAVRNPVFPHMHRPEPIADNLHGLSAAVRERKADVGLATDGDADRVGLVDEHGDFVNQLVVYALMAYYLLEVRKQRGAIVKAISTTSMLEKLGQIYDVPVYETGVGFKYVAPKMLETDAMIGGEESGGYAFRGHMPERDGILASLFLLDLVRHSGKTPSQLVKQLFDLVGPHYYDRLDTSYPLAQREAITKRMLANPPKEIDGSAVVRVQTDDGFKYHVADGSWLLIRFSGTEPIMRIYTETNEPQRVPRFIDAGRKLVGI